MEIQRYIRILKSRKWVVILTTIVTLVVVALGSISMTPVYSASAMVRVTAGLSGSVTYNDLNYTDRLIQTYVQLLKSRPFMAGITERLNLQVRPEALVDTIKVEALPGTELIKITVENTDAWKAAAIAGTLGNLLVDEAQKLYSGQGKTAREILQEQVAVIEDQLRQDRIRLASLSASTPSPNQDLEATRQDLATRITAEEQTYTMLLNQYDKARIDEAMRANSINIVEPPVTPEVPSKPNIKLNVVLGALVGLMAGIGLAFLFENLSPRLHSTDELAETAGVPLLGQIPNFDIQARNHRTSIVLSNGNASSPAADSFRALSAGILAQMSYARLKTILITSPEPGVGKSTVTANLAVALGEAGRRVIVVDGDLQRPRQHEIFGLVAQEPGLCDLLLNPTQLDLAVQPTKMRRVSAVAVGSARYRSSEFANAQAIAEVMGMLAKEADVVLWDSPPLLAAVDAALLAPLADGVMLVVERAQTQRETVQSACQQLVDVKAKLIGIIANRVENHISYPYYYQRSAKGGWWSRAQKGIRSVDSSRLGKKVFNGKK